MRGLEGDGTEVRMLNKLINLIKKKSGKDWSSLLNYILERWLGTSQLQTRKSGSTGQTALSNPGAQLLDTQLIKSSVQLPVLLKLHFLQFSSYASERKSQFLKTIQYKRRQYLQHNSQLVPNRNPGTVHQILSSWRPPSLASSCVVQHLPKHLPKMVMQSKQSVNTGKGCRQFTRPVVLCRPGMG